MLPHTFAWLNGLLKWLQPQTLCTCLDWKSFFAFAHWRPTAVPCAQPEDPYQTVAQGGC